MFNWIYQYSGTCYINYKISLWVPVRTDRQYVLMDLLPTKRSNSPQMCGNIIYYRIYDYLLHILGGFEVLGLLLPNTDIFQLVSIQSFSFILLLNLNF